MGDGFDLVSIGIFGDEQPGSNVQKARAAD
jgi:hypothetical protein